VPVQLAGREARFGEPPARHAAEIVDALVDPLLARADRPYALFGHSMGALLAFELAHAAVARGRPPAVLFVSGYGAPHVRPPDREAVGSWTDDQLAARVRQLQGTDMGEEDFAAMFPVLAPVFRADFGICEVYRYRPRPPLPLPIVVLNGRDDPTAPRHEVDAWPDLGTAGVARHDFPGDHFYLRSQLDAVLATVETEMRAAAPAAVPTGVEGAR
jgi:surfactin synthase thioesterase subunit